MRWLRSFLVALIVFVLLGPLSLTAQASDAQRRHPRGDGRGSRDYRRSHQPRPNYRPYRNHRSGRYDYRPQYRHRRHYGYRNNYRPLCRYQTGYWAYGPYGEYFVPTGTGSYLAPCW